jgi:secreted trypsin-like serine protease
MKFALCFFVFLSIFDCLLSLYQGNSVSTSNGKYVASVRLKSKQFDSDYGFLCAATFIDHLNILTAASCVFGLKPSDLQVVMGSPDLFRKYFETKVTRITIHQSFNQSNPLQNNIAVLRLSRVTKQNNGNREINRFVENIKLAEATPTSSQSCQLFAWGVGNNLLQATLPVWQENLCRNSSAGTFCAGNLNNGPAVCPRNLGGPFVCNFKLAGFVIDDTGCRESGKTGQFHSVHHYRDWIKAVSNARFSSEVSISLMMFVVILMSWL